MEKNKADLHNSSRRNLLKGALIGSAVIGAPVVAFAQSATPSKDVAVLEPDTAAYVFFTPNEASFIEALVNHMVPADEHSPSGTDLGINIFIDRALSGSWGKGDRMYMQGPWQKGEPTQGYQSPLLPSELVRAGIAATNQSCKKSEGKTFDLLDAQRKEATLKSLSSGEIVFNDELSSILFFDTLYQSVVEGLFSDPIYGGNKNKLAWKMIGFPGVIETNTLNIVQYKNKAYPGKILSIVDVS